MTQPVPAKGERERLHGCTLPTQDEWPGMGAGTWVDATCAEYQAAIAAHGGTAELSVWSALTDFDGEYGRPTVYTCWGERDGNPVAADGGTREQWRQRPCAMDHVVFITLTTSKGTGNE